MQSRPVPAYDGVSLKLIFLKGNSHELGYDGLDRVINSIAISKYRDNIHFKIIGSISERERSIYEKFEFVELKGFLTGKSLEQEIIEAHAGIATMSLYRNKVQEASALKVREYFSKGLPFLYGYKDSDIDRFPEMQKYCLRFPNDDSLLDMELIKKFLDDFYQHPERIDEMVDVAKRHLSWKIKMGETMKFVESARNENATAQSNLPS
jgi:hypothetical protein